MKTNIKIMVTLLLAGVLFFSCSLVSREEYGTLILRLPGESSNARIMKSGAEEDELFTGFVRMLSYHIACNAPGFNGLTVGPDTASVPISLPAGTWTITVTVFKAEGYDIGSNTLDVTIKAGETTVTDPFTIKIDTSLCKMINFELIINGTSYIGKIPDDSLVEDGDNMYIIKVTIPSGIYNNMSTTQVDCKMIHTGAREIIEHPPNESFLLYEFDGLYISIIAANGMDSTLCLISLVKDKDEQEPDGTGEWPSGDIWKSFGFPGSINQPGGEVFLSLVDEMMCIILTGSTGADINTLMDTIQADLAGEWVRQLLLYNVAFNVFKYGDNSLFLMYGGRYGFNALSDSNYPIIADYPDLFSGLPNSNLLYLMIIPGASFDPVIGDFTLPEKVKIVYETDTFVTTTLIKIGENYFYSYNDIETISDTFLKFSGGIGGTWMKYTRFSIDGTFPPWEEEIYPYDAEQVSNEVRYFLSFMMNDSLFFDLPWALKEGPKMFGDVYTEGYTLSMPDMIITFYQDPVTNLFFEYTCTAKESTHTEVTTWDTSVTDFGSITIPNDPGELPVEPMG